MRRQSKRSIRGANKVDVTAKVTINNRAQVIDVNVKVTVDKGDPAGCAAACRRSSSR